MAIHFGNSSYFRANKGVDRYLLENYLLPGLERQAVIAGGSRGIELPVGENQEPEYLSLEEAKGLVLDWLEQSENLLEGDKKKLERIKNYQQFANLASNIYESRVQDPNKLVTAARLQNIAELRAANKAGSTTSSPHYDPGKVIDDYNKMYLRLLASSRSGIPRNLLQQIVSGGIPSDLGNIREDALAAVISSNLSRLHAAGSVGSSVEAQNYAVSQELGRIIATSYPEMTGILNILGDAQTSRSIREVTNRLVSELETTTSIENYEKVQVAAISSSDHYLLNQAELKTQIYNSFPSMSATDRQNLTNALLREMVTSARSPLTSVEIVERVSQILKIPPSELATIQAALNKSGASVSLEYRQNELSLLVGSHYLTAGERKLLNKGINPFLVHNSLDKLTSIEAKYLSEYNEVAGHNKEFITLKEAYDNERQSINPDLSFIKKTRAHFDQLDSYSDLSISDKALIRRTRLGRWVADSRSRIYETRGKFITKWGDIEDTISGKKLLNKFLDNWDEISKKITVPGTNIPFFKIVPWLYDRFAEWKKITTLSVVARTSKSTGWIGKSIHWAAKNYELGGYTTRGATAHFASSQWGRLVKWTLVKSGMSSVLKYSAKYGTIKVANAGLRTATRLLLKIGGKALAKIGSKALSALITSATGVLAVIFAIGIVFDVISIGWEFLREFIRNSEFRKTIVGWGVAISAVFASINLGGIVLAIGAVFASTFGLIITALIIVGGIIFIVPDVPNRIEKSFYLDSGITQLITSILCNEPGDTTSVSTEPTNKVASCASCLVKYLNECYGKSTNKTTIAKGVGCLVAKAIAPDVASIIAASANSFTYLQCVGFVQAAVKCGGGSLEGHNACGYVGLNSSGFKFVSGLSGAKPGDPIVFNSSGSCSDGAPGHIGILKEDAGALVCLIDANSICSGCPSDNNCLPKTNLAGYLKKI